MIFLLCIAASAILLCNAEECVCVKSRQPIRSTSNSHGHIETYIDAGYCMEKAFDISQSWVAVHFQKHVVLETFEAVGMVEKTKDVQINTECPRTYPGPKQCNGRSCLHGQCHNLNFVNGQTEWCICDSNFKGQECNETYVCHRSQVSLAGKCYDVINSHLKNHNLSYIPEYNFTGTIYPLNDDCIISTSTNANVRGVYCHCGETRALLYNNHLYQMCGCPSGQMKKLDGKCVDYCVHGTCINSTLVPTCACGPGYTGKRCETRIHVPVTNRCNGNACIHGICIGSYCLCDLGWTGTDCNSIQHCDSSRYSVASVCMDYISILKQGNVTGLPMCNDVFNTKEVENHCNNFISTADVTKQLCRIYPYTKSGVACVHLDPIHPSPTNYTLSTIDGHPLQPVDHTLEGEVVAEACFPANSYVLSKNNKTITMESLKVGESILTVDTFGNYQYTKVILMMHSSRNGKLKYRKITTEGGKSLEISSEHLLYVGENPNDLSVMVAMKVQEGDYIQVFDKYHGKTGAARVIKISENTRRGLYAPLTDTGNLIVDDHLVSSYATYENQGHVHTLFAPWRLAYYIRTLIMGHDKYLPPETDAHWSIKGLLMFADMKCYLFNDEYCSYMNMFSR